MNFHVGRGEIFGFLGPSGAGKSTIQKVLTGLNTKYKGSVKVVGTEIRERTNRFYENIGVDFEFSTCYEKHKEAADPFGIFDICLIAFLRLCIFGMDKSDKAGSFKDIEYWNPVLAGRFHTNFRTGVFCKPCS